jgi:Fe-S-cluster containining protein
MTKENIEKKLEINIMLEEIKAAYNDLVYYLDFECLGCGKCGCITIGFKKIILLMSEEIETLKEKGKIDGVVPHGKTGYLKFNKKRCSFLNKHYKCEIHEYKPLICLLHPFQVFTVGFVFGGGMIFDTKCSWVKENRSKLDNPSKDVLEAYYKLYSLVLEYKKKLRNFEVIR